MGQPPGRRERKKAATRRAIADAALELFSERGFEAVGVREVAEAADVSTATLFKHFPGKEALVVDEDVDAEAALVAAVRDRPAGQGIVGALHDHLRAVVASVEDADPERRRSHDLVESSEALREYSRRLWLRHEAALTAVIVEECDGRVHPTTCAALAHFVLETRGLLQGEPDPTAALDRIMVLLEQGWSAHLPSGRRS